MAFLDLVRKVEENIYNAGLGFIEDDELLKLSLEYVKKHGG